MKKHSVILIVIIHPKFFMNDNFIVIYDLAVLAIITYNYSIPFMGGFIANLNSHGLEYIAEIH